MKISDLRPNSKNPRKISKQKLEALKKSMDKFGDLSGFVFNVNTNSLVSGHQRTKTIPHGATIKIEHKYETRTAACTVAEGYVLINGERFKYREVDATHEWEMEALLAANKHSGEWDTELLRVAISEIKDIEVTGFTIPELKSLSIEMPKIQTDEQYVSQTKKTTEQIPTENPNENQVAEAPVEKKMDVVGKRWVVIIDCNDEAHKNQIREKIRPLIEEAGAKIF